MEATPGTVKRLLRNLYHPVALRRDPLANATRFIRRSTPTARPFDENDVRLVQRFVLWCVTMLDAQQQTLRGALQRKRQRVIIEQYDIGGQPRDRVASDLGISLRQFYRERQVALQRLADAVCDAFTSVQRERSAQAHEPHQPSDLPVRQLSDDAFFGRAV